MDGPSSQQKPRATSPGGRADALVRDGERRLELQANAGAGTRSGYSILVRGVVESSSVLSSTDPEETVTMLENETKLLTGELTGGTAGFLVDGEILAAEFDDPAPSVKLGGGYVDPARWPSVKEYTGFGPGQDPVEDPFPEGSELGGAADDPLDPDEFVVELEAVGTSDPEAYCFDVDGEVLEVDGGPTVSEAGDRVYGCLRPGDAARVTIRGFVTRVDTADGIDFAVGGRGDAR